MSNAPDILECDQSDVFARLRADDTLAAVPMLLQRKGVTESDVETALGVLNEVGGKVGVVVIVLMPELAADTPNLPGPRGRLTVTVQVIENPIFNLGESGIGLSAESIATRIRGLLHHFSPGGSVFIFDGQEPVAVAAPQISYGVKFTRPVGDVPRAKVSRPTIVVAEGSCTLACATAGAAIHYTTDGSYPSAVGAAATLYAAPFAVEPGTTIRAAASKAGAQQSDIAQATA